MSLLICCAPFRILLLNFRLGSRVGVRRIWGLLYRPLNIRIDRSCNIIFYLLLGVGTGWMLAPSLLLVVGFVAGLCTTYYYVETSPL